MTKRLDFALLKKRPTFLRLDVLAAPTIAFLYHYIFGEVAFDIEHLLATVSLILSVTLIFVIFLLNFWSVSAHTFMTYRVLSKSITSNTDTKALMETCTHVRIRLENVKQHTVKRYIVPITSNTIATSSGQVTKTYQIEFNKKRLLFNAEKKTFSHIPFPIHDTIETYQNAHGLTNE